MSRNEPTIERARRIMARLDLRIERQVRLPNAGQPHCVDSITLYHNHAGFIERRVLPFIDELSPSRVAGHLRTLKNRVDWHLEEAS